VRIIAATNKDLLSLVNKGMFREDLYFRLNVIPIRVPPLRERKDDIPLIADHFLEQQCTENGVPKKQLSSEAVTFLKSTNWEQNNVRELENLMKRAAILIKAQEITPRDLQPLMEPARNAAQIEAKTLREARDEFERDLIRNALARNNWDKSKTAAELDIERAHLYRKLKDLGIAE
jgi:two-component system nitrogen regulation response regulator NtrX